MEERADEDEWLIESLRRYSDLHVFELQEPTRVIEWTSDKSVCVAGYRAAKKHDILELLLPQKLSAKDNRGLCPERDFKVQHGGFSQEPVNCLKYILGTRCVVTSGDPGSSLQLWQIAADDSDAIKKTGYIHVKRKGKTTRKLASGLGGAPAVLHGSQIGDVQLTDLTSGQALYTAGEDSSDAVGALRFVDASVFLVCAESGELRVGDVREPSALRRAAAAGEQGESCCCMDLKDGAVARLFSTAQVVVSDLRDLRRPLSQARLNIRSGAASSHFLTVSWAPALHNCLSVSGTSGLVHIYDATAWTAELAEAQALFVHRGHLMSPGPEADPNATLVTAHVWHPWRPRTLLSAATDGSFHVWDWVEDRPSG